MFLINDDFDKSMIFFIRSLTKNFILENRERSINQLPIEAAVVVEQEQNVTLDNYIENVVMKMFTDAEGCLLNIVPIALRMNVYIVNVDTSPKAKDGYL